MSLGRRRASTLRMKSAARGRIAPTTVVKSGCGAARTARAARFLQLLAHPSSGVSARSVPATEHRRPPHSSDRLELAQWLAPTAHGRSSLATARQTRCCCVRQSAQRSLSGRLQPPRRRAARRGARSFRQLPASAIERPPALRRRRTPSAGYPAPFERRAMRHPSALPGPVAATAAAAYQETSLGSRPACRTTRHGALPALSDEPEANAGATRGRSDPLSRRREAASAGEQEDSTERDRDRALGRAEFRTFQAKRGRH